MKYNQIYGRYCFGTGSWLGKRNVFKSSNLYNKFVIDSYKTVIKQDLLRINSFKNLNFKNILDVGTGRNSLAFEDLGFKKIYHVDISKFNYENLSQIIKKNKKKNIKTFNLNLEENKFNQLKINIDIAYLHGIIHHMKFPERALKNIDKKLKKKGLIWIHFYQLGSFSNICIKLAKKILRIRNIKMNILYNYFKKKLKIKDLDVVIDTLGCDYLKLYKGKDIFQLMKLNGYSLIYSKDVYLNEKSSIRTSTQSGILVFKKNKKKIFKPIKIKENSYLDINEYCEEDKDLIKNLNLLEKIILKKINKKTHIAKILRILFEIIIVWRSNSLLDPHAKKVLKLNNLFLKIVKIL